MKKFLFAVAILILSPLTASAQRWHNNPNYDYYKGGNYTPYYPGFNAPGRYYNRGSTNYGGGFYYAPRGNRWPQSQFDYYPRGNYYQYYQAPYYFNFGRWPY